MDSYKSCKFNTIALPSSKVIYPGETLDISIPKSAPQSGYVSISPSFSDAYDNKLWQPQICEIINGKALFKNLSVSPLLPPKHCHFRPHPVTIATLTESISEKNDSRSFHHDIIDKTQPKIAPSFLGDIASITINKNILSESQVLRLDSIHEQFHEVFNNDLRKGYNQSAGKFFADFSFSTKPPPTKVFSPQYSKKCADLQQAKCDELEEQGVLVDPKLYDIPILHVSPCWIQQKGRARHKNLQDCSLDELRFITAFNMLKRLY